MEPKLKTKVIRQSVVIPASPGDVYNAFMNPRIHGAVTGGKATGAAKVGGKFSAWDGYITGKNLKLVKGKRIVQEWITNDWQEGYPPSKLDLSFVKKGEGTVLKMVHSGVPAKQASSYADGWKEFYWTPLKEYFSSKKSK